MKIISRLMVQILVSLIYVLGADASESVLYPKFDDFKVIITNKVNLLPVCYNKITGEWQVLLAQDGVIVNGYFSDELKPFTLKPFTLEVGPEIYSEGVSTSAWKPQAEKAITRMFKEGLGITTITTDMVRSAIRVVAPRHGRILLAYYFVIIPFGPETKAQLMYEKLQKYNEKIKSEEIARRTTILDGVLRDTNLLEGDNWRQIFPTLEFVGKRGAVDLKWKTFDAIPKDLKSLVESVVPQITGLAQNR
jgi:hypothetical protein